VLKHVTFHPVKYESSVFTCHAHSRCCYIGTRARARTHARTHTHTHTHRFFLVDNEYPATFNTSLYPLADPHRHIRPFSVALTLSTLGSTGQVETHVSTDIL
jgi:hypothetical protein